VTADGNTLLVAESNADRLTAFTIQNDGSLAERRVFARLPTASSPDGLCLDRDGAAWVALFEGDAFLRIGPDGQIVDRILAPERRAVACVLGGEPRTSLYCVTAETTTAELREGRSRARVTVVEVEVPGAGFP